MPLIPYHFPLGIDEVKGKTAELCTGTTVGTAPETVLRGIALSAVADTERTMHKYLEFGIGHCGVYLSYLLQREFASQHHTGKANAGEKFYLLDCAVIHLRACVQRDRRYIHPSKSHILDNKGIDTNIIQLGHKFLDSSHLLVINNSIKRNIYLYTEYMCILHKFCNILNRVTGSLARAEL